MTMMKYIYGPIPSRRLGRSLGISPIIKKACNYSCVYCQLGRTDHLSNKREMFFPVDDIVAEFDQMMLSDIKIDVVTIVGEGEPTLYLGLKELIEKIKASTDKPIAIITNGALLNDEEVKQALMLADIVLPSIDAYDEKTFIKINRPYPTIKYNVVKTGLINFSKEYKGQLWLEMMLMKKINDDRSDLLAYKDLLSEIKYDRLYINTPVRPPAETGIQEVDQDKMNEAVDLLAGIAINLLVDNGFYSDIKDDHDAILSIIKRHPMNQHEIAGFLKNRQNEQPEMVMTKLASDPRIEIIEYKGYHTYRLK